MKKLVIILSVVAGLAIIIFFVAGYFLGNVPLASSLLGTNKPRNLGVNISVDNAYRGIKDFKCPSTPQDVADIIKNPKSYTTIKTTLTSEEASSLLSLGGIPDCPFKETQIKFGPDGNAQVSGVLDVTALQKFLRNMGVSGDNLDIIMGYVKNAKYLNFYIDANCSVVNNRVTGKINTLQVGRINLPDSVIQNKGSIANYVSDTLTSNGYNIRNLTISDGKVNIDMDRPLSSVQNWLKFVQY
jgi:hypothetical protein